jgi:serine/threonine protein kinase
MPEKILYSGNRRKVVLTGPGKTGGEGSIYKVKEEPFLCAKIYHRNKLNPEIKNKIEAMIKNPPGENLAGRSGSLRSSSVSWPVESLYDSCKDDAEFLGFTMPLVDTSLFREAHRYYDPDDRIKYLGGSFSWLYLLTAAFNISYVTAALHEKGHKIGDMSASNILIARTAAISIIDCDSFQIQDKNTKKTYYTKVATGDFLPPELMGRNFRDENIDRYYSDLFGLGVIVFRLLMNGFHPYQARGKKVSGLPTIEQKILAGNYPYGRENADLLPPKNSLPYEIIPQGIRDLFRCCFIEGHGNLHRRPKASEWAEKLKTELSGVKQCKNNPNHWYSGHLQECPWCKMIKDGRLKKDLFPPPDKNKKTFAYRSVPFGNRFKPAKIFTPVLRASPEKVELRPLKSGLIKFSIVLENTGDGILSGSVSSDRKWITVKDSVISTAKKTVKKIITDSSMVFLGSPGIKYAGNIIVSTNGGNTKIPVTVAAGKNPCAEVSLEKIIMKKIKRGDMVTKNLVIKNKGDGILSGSTESNRRWLTVSPKVFRTGSAATVKIEIDTKNADNSLFIAGKIDVFTNGGNFKISVALTLVP